MPLLEPHCLRLDRGVLGRHRGRRAEPGRPGRGLRSSRSRLRVIRRVRGTAGLFLRASGFPRRAPGLGELSLRRVVAPALLHKRRGDRLELGYRLLPRRLRLARGGHEPRHLRLGRVGVRAVQRGGRRRHLGGGLRRRLGARRGERHLRLRQRRPRVHQLPLQAARDGIGVLPGRVRRGDARVRAPDVRVPRLERRAPRLLGVALGALFGTRQVQLEPPPHHLDLLLRFRARIRGILPRARHRLVRTARRRVFGAVRALASLLDEDPRARVAVAHGALRRGAALCHLAVAAVAHQTQLVFHPPALRRRGLRAASVRVSLGARALDVRAHLREHARVFLPARRLCRHQLVHFLLERPRGDALARGELLPHRRLPGDGHLFVRRGLVRRGRRGVEPAPQALDLLLRGLSRRDG